METQEWYQQLNKPFFAPPPGAFGVAWGILYPIIFASFGYVFYQGWRKKIPFRVVLPFMINLVGNLIFPPIQLGTRNFLLAAVDITIVVLSLVWAMKAIWPYSKKITWLQIPYLFWGLFATLLQYSLFWLNRSNSNQ